MQAIKFLPLQGPGLYKITKIRPLEGYGDQACVRLHGSCVCKVT